jgi:hypothetical protein
MNSKGSDFFGAFFVSAGSRIYAGWSIRLS